MDTERSWYDAKLNKMDVVRVSESEDWWVDYDRARGMYRVSVFQDNHFKDEYWFDAYEEKENVHGHWFLLDECANAGVYCSVCHKKVYTEHYANVKLKSKFCPNCGAIMDGQFVKL